LGEVGAFAFLVSDRLQFAAFPQKVSNMLAYDKLKFVGPALHFAAF
jgi:hypothetical protein